MGLRAIFAATSGLSRISRFISTCDARRPTIFSLCSGAGKSGVAVFRISGPSSANVLTSMTKWDDQAMDTKQVNLKKIYHPSTKEQIDRGMVLWFPSPNSFTGEDVCELHVHGGPAIIKQIYNALSLLPETRHALPGEFIKRSFENGKVDLTQVEGLSDLLNAENELQRKQALKMMEGNSKNLYTDWSTKLMKGMAHIEAFIDFGEEEHMGEKIFLDVKRNMTSLADEIGLHLKDGGMYEKIRDGLRMCIVGEPNVGKSSLLNSLCKRPVSIVTSHAGTTRDIIEVPLNVEGHQVLVSDTAGLRRDVPDEVERIGIERAYDQTRKSDVMILVVDSTSADVENLCCGQTLDPHLMEPFVLDQLKKLDLYQDSCLKPQKILLVFNKIDAASEKVLSAVGRAHRLTIEKKHLKVTLTNGHPEESDELELNSPPHSIDIECDSPPLLFTWCATSCFTEGGLDELSTRIRDFVDEMLLSGNTGKSHPMNARHRHHLEKVLMQLREFLDIVSEPAPSSDYDTRLEISAEKLRGALHQMGLITGLITTDEILSQIFKDFCIGK